MTKAKRCFGTPPPGLDLSRLTGALIVIEGPDSSGRSTHVGLLAEWLEQNGYPVVQIGLKRSRLVGNELEAAKEGNVLSPRTMSLFYATDFYDQLENTMVPALRAGSVVLADRYTFTPMARDVVRPRARCRFLPAGLRPHARRPHTRVSWRTRLLGVRYGPRPRT